jgi:anti-anti-sigma regulatory factor
VESAEKKHILLDENLSYSRSSTLLEAIQTQNSDPTALDASKVRHLDAPCAQILLAAKLHFDAANIPFEITNPSTKFGEALAALGLNEALLSPQEVN